MDQGLFLKLNSFYHQRFSRIIWKWSHYSNQVSIRTSRIGTRLREPVTSQNVLYLLKRKRIKLVLFWNVAIESFLFWIYWLFCLFYCFGGKMLRVYQGSVSSLALRFEVDLILARLVQPFIVSMLRYVFSESAWLSYYVLNVTICLLKNDYLRIDR